MNSEPLPRLSVVSAWYNRTDSLEESVRSILDQEGVDLEYIIVDDCSTDETATRLAALSDPRLTVLRNARNQGFTRSIRRAVEAARGEYVAVHGAGDLSLPGRLAAQVVFLDSHPDHVVVGTAVTNHDLASGTRNVLPFRPSSGSMNIYTHGEVMFRRVAYDTVGGYRDVFYYSQDSDLWRRLGEIGRLGRIDDLLYERRIFADGVALNREKEVLQAVFSNLGAHAASERAAGRRDPVDKWGAAAILTQSLTQHFKTRGTLVIRALLRERGLAETKAALERIPLGLLTWKLLLLYLLLALFYPKPRLKPVPPMETLRNDPDGV